MLMFIIAGLLFLCAWQQWQHERAMQAAELRWSQHPQLMWLPTPRAHTPPSERDAFRTWLPLAPEPLPTSHMPFLLERKPDRLTVTRRMHPRFENYGTDISISPTIWVT